MSNQRSSKQEKRKSKHLCVKCGRKAIFHKRRKSDGKMIISVGTSHELCPRCWQSLYDSHIRKA